MWDVEGSYLNELGEEFVKNQEGELAEIREKVESG